jgi:uncharacterized protein
VIAAALGYRRRVAAPVSNAEVVRRVFDVLNEKGVEAALDLIDEDVEAVIGPEVSAEPDVYRGHDGVRRYFAGFGGAFEDVRFEILDLAEEGDSVIVETSLKGRGVASGLEMDLRTVGVWQLREGRVARLEAFPDLESARAALDAQR